MELDTARLTPRARENVKRQRHKVLIVKLGYSETLVGGSTRICSLGDVFRTTVILHLYKDDHVTWLTDAAAVPLLKDNPYIDRILTFGPLSTLQLESERFDMVINLEKVPGICALVSRISAWAFYGFRFDPDTGEAKAYDRASEALAIATLEDVKKLNDKPWAEVLYSVLGAEWAGQSYVLGYRPETAVQFDLGFNHQVGPKFPVKNWPAENWQRLEDLIDGRYTITYQQGLDDLRAYMDWINTCRLLITNDSLGIYLGLALGRRVLVLVGPTSATELLPHDNLRIVKPSLERECMPCCAARCALDDPCMNYISPRQILDAIAEWGLE